VSVSLCILTQYASYKYTLRGPRAWSVVRRLRSLAFHT
jgi:hypothetical protein